MCTDKRQPTASNYEVIWGSGRHTWPQNTDVISSHEKIIRKYEVVDLVHDLRIPTSYQVMISFGRTSDSFSRQKNLVKSKKNPQNSTSYFLSQASFHALWCCQWTLHRLLTDGALSPVEQRIRIQREFRIKTILDQNYKLSVCCTNKEYFHT